MELVIEVQVKSVYGTERIYPMNDIAKKLADLIDAKTFTKDTLNKIKELGFKIKWVPIVLP